MSYQGQSIRVVETGQVFNTIKECAEAINGYPAGITHCLAGRRKNHRGYTFERVGELRRGFDLDRMKKFQAKKQPVRIIETGQVFESLAACARAIGGRSSGVCNCLMGRQKNHMGYTFERVIR